MDSEALKEPTDLTEPSLQDETPAAEQAPVLSNHFHYDEATLKKTYQQLLRPLVLFQLIFGVIAVALAAYNFLSHRNDLSQNNAMMMVLPLLLLGGFEIWRALRSVPQAVKKTLQQAEVPEYDIDLRFEADGAVIKSSLLAEPGHMAYSNFRRVKRYQDLILITTVIRKSFTLDPNGFQNGTEADFWRLMNEKCPLAVPKAQRNI